MTTAARAAAGQQGGGRTRWRLLGWAVLLSLALHVVVLAVISVGQGEACLLYTSDAADE